MRRILRKTVRKTSQRSKLATEFAIITTAFHEAGHALAVLLNFGYVHFAALYVNKMITPNADLGKADYDGAADLDIVQDSELLNRLLMADIAIYQAGLAAEKLFYKDISGIEQLPYVLKKGSYIDFGYVSDIIKKYNLAPPGKKRYAFKKKTFRQTQKLLSNNWGDVKLIAHLLFAKKKIYFEDLKQLLTKKSPKKKFWKEQFKSIEMLHNAPEELPEAQLKKLFKI